MFGLEDKAKKEQKSEAETFDLENEIRDPNKCAALKKKVDARVQELKQLLRTGEQKQEFDNLGVLLHGYAALQTLITKMTRKK